MATIGSPTPIDKWTKYYVRNSKDGGPIQALFETNAIAMSNRAEQTFNDVNRLTEFITGSSYGNMILIPGRTCIMQLVHHGFACNTREGFTLAFAHGNLGNCTTFKTIPREEMVAPIAGRIDAEEGERTIRQCPQSGQHAWCGIRRRVRRPRPRGKRHPGQSSYCSTDSEALFGTGQGSGASPAAWLTLVVIMMNTMDRLVSERVTFRSPDTSMCHERLIDAFVDDTSISFTDSGDKSYDDMVATITSIASLWDRLLFYSGGSLNLQKCAWHITYWEWEHGRPRLRIPNSNDKQIVICSAQTGKDETIKQQHYHQSSRILGAHLTPSGEFATQLSVMRDKADNYAIKLRSPRLRPSDIWTFIKTTYVPAMRYVLPCLAVDEEELNRVQSKFLASALQKLGLSSKMPTAVRHGPKELGGLDLPDLRTEVGIERLKFLRHAIFSESEVGKMILLCLKYAQIESGIKEHLLESPGIYLSYITSTWLTSLRQFLYQHNMTLSITDSLSIVFQGQHDQCIMQPTKLSRFSPRQQLDINLVRLYLQVITLSDISTMDGKEMTIYALKGIRNPLMEVRRRWPAQSTPTKQQIKVWQQYITESYLSMARRWKTKLGDIRPNNWRTHQRAVQADETQLLAHQFTTLKQYIRSLPQWYRRLLANYEQLATDQQVWRAFRSRKHTVDIASDGGLANGIGTFGWKIVTTNNDTVLFQGSGPIDGPAEVDSSTRSELGGYAAPLLLATSLARFWGIRHRCHFRWFTDSTSAISKVRVYTSSRGKHKQYPAHSDYVTTIMELTEELKRPITASWVRGHQDAHNDYSDLSREAKLNIDVDELATNHRLTRNSQPMRNVQHLSSQKVTMTINGQRFPTNWDTNIRWTINGTYLKVYLQSKYKWSDAPWQSIDHDHLYQHMRSLTYSVRVQRLKFMYDMQPLGYKKQQMSQFAHNDVIANCPCCQNMIETPHHLIHCKSNPARSLAMVELTSQSKRESHPYTTAVLDCIEQWLTNPELHPTTKASISPNVGNFEQIMKPHMLQILESALQEQEQIGWHNFIKGYQSKVWRELAHTNMDSPGVQASSHDGDRRMSDVYSRVAAFVTQLWKGRNEALHKGSIDDTRLYQSLEAAEIRHYFNQPHLLPVGDQHYCAGQLVKLLRSGAATRRRWLQRVRRARKDMISNTNRQTKITNYFRRNNNSTRLSTEASQPIPDDSRISGLHPNLAPTSINCADILVITQPHVFPGRPPDPQDPQQFSQFNKSPAP